MTHTEQIRKVAEYMHPQAKWVEDNHGCYLVMPYPETFDGGFPVLGLEMFDAYTTSLNDLAPVYKKVMGELEALRTKYDRKGKYIEAKEVGRIAGSIVWNLEKFEPAPLFEAIVQAITFLTENKEK